jgi:periplasmic protein CpxP/Spy
MTKLKTIGAAGVLLLGTSVLALAQTNSMTNSPTNSGGTNSGTMMGQPTSPPQGGSHPTMTSPQNAPASRGMTGSSGATAPGPQTASTMTQQDVKKRLQDAGYKSVTDIKPDKNGGYTARAMHSGKRVTVDVDGNGQIQPMK